MKISLGILRRIIREAATGAFPGGPTRNILSPDTNNREQIGPLADGEPVDTAADPEGLPDHLLDPTVDPEDCWGPVPPTSEKPYLQVDPSVKDYGVKPTSSIKRG